MKTCDVNQTTRPGEVELSFNPAIIHPSDALQPNDLAAISLTELVNHIQSTHHAYLRDALPKLAQLTKTIAALYGDRDPRLSKVRDTFGMLALELSQHLLKEEICLFPVIRLMDGGGQCAGEHFETLASPIRQMESEHGDAHSALESLRDLTDGYAPPEWACETYRSLLAALAHFEYDLRLHIHKEDEVLFPRALKMEAASRASRTH
jgi:regulator of cell morphogenesis and NO signaling